LLVRPTQPPRQPLLCHHSTPSATLHFPDTKLLHCLLVSRATVAPVLASDRRAPLCSPSMWWLVEIQKITRFPFFFAFCIIVFVILVVVLCFVRFLLGFSLFLFFFSCFLLFLVFLWLFSLSGIVALWWDCVTFGNVSIFASSQFHSLRFSRSQVLIFVI